MKVEQALEDMRLDRSALNEARLFHKSDVNLLLGRLRKTIDILNKKVEITSFPKPPVDAEKVWEKWESTGYDLASLDGRELRTICVDPGTAVRPKLVQALMTNQTAFKRNSTLFGFVNAYFAGWRTFPSAELLEKLIVELIGAKRKTSHSIIISAWTENIALFTPSADNYIADKMVRERISVAKLCEKLFVSPTSYLANRAADHAFILAIKSAIAWARTRNEAETVAEIEWIAQNLSGTSISPGAFREGVGILILSDVTDKYDGVKKSIAHIVNLDSRLGDPRLAATQANWRNMPPGSRQTVLSWMVKETIEFFFNTLVPKNDENRRRADFWLTYAKRPGNIKDFQVAICDGDKYKLRGQQNKNIEYATMVGAKTSAFMMLFEGVGGQQYVIIEFSVTGNAAYIYDKTKFESNGDNLRYTLFDIRSLKRMNDARDRIIHSGDWEYGAGSSLYELGIRR